MKKTLLFFASLIFTLGFAGEWDQCEKVSYTAVIDSVSPGVYHVTVTVTNTHSFEEFPNDNDGLGFCHYGLLENEGDISLTKDDQCVSPIAALGNVVLHYDILVKDTTVHEACLNIELKETFSQLLSCDTTFCFPVTGYYALAVEEIDLTGIPFEEIYFDLMGRKVIAPKSNSLYIVKKLYENGYEVVEKIYFSEME